MGAMAIDDPVVYVPSDQRKESLPATPGVVREEAVAVEGMWAGVAITEAGMTSGWHHHGDYDTTVYVVSGALRMESGPGGEAVVEAGPGTPCSFPRGQFTARATRRGPRATLWSCGPGSVRP